MSVQKLQFSLLYKMMGLWLHFFILILILTAQKNDNPNFIIFFVDDMGYGDLSYTGHPTIYTPNIDYYAYNGKRFTQWYSGYHICTGSRSSLLTGRVPVRSGMCGTWYGEVLMPGSIGGLDPYKELTFTKIMKQQNLGYATKIIGKWFVLFIFHFILNKNIEKYI